MKSKKFTTKKSKGQSWKENLKDAPPKERNPVNFKEAMKKLLNLSSDKLKELKKIGIVLLSILRF